MPRSPTTLSIESLPYSKTIFTFFFSPSFLISTKVLSATRRAVSPLFTMTVSVVVRVVFLSCACAVRMTAEPIKLNRIFFMVVFYRCYLNFFERGSPDASGIISVFIYKSEEWQERLHRKENIIYTFTIKIYRFERNYISRGFRHPLTPTDTGR